MTTERDKPIITKTQGGIATERFRNHLRERLAQIRENAVGIGASSSYINHLDHSVKMVLLAVSAEREQKSGSEISRQSTADDTP